MTDNPVSSYNYNQENAYNKKTEPKVNLAVFSKKRMSIYYYMYMVCVVWRMCSE